MVCPECRRDMICFGKKFTPPPRRDFHQWQKLEWMIQNGWRGYGWPTQPKMNLSEVQESLATSAKAEKAATRAKEDAAFLERRRATRNPHAKLNKKRLQAELKRQEAYQNAVLESLARS